MKPLTVLVLSCTAWAGGPEWEERAACCSACCSALPRGLQHDDTMTRMDGWMDGDTGVFPSAQRDTWRPSNGYRLPCCRESLPSGFNEPECIELMVVCFPILSVSGNVLLGRLRRPPGLEQRECCFVARGLGLVSFFILAPRRPYLEVGNAFEEDYTGSNI